MDKNIEGFEELKSQVEILKNKLSKEEITNERLMRKTMSTRVNDVERYLYKVGIMGILAMALIAFDFFGALPTVNLVCHCDGSAAVMLPCVCLLQQETCQFRQHHVRQPYRREPPSGAIQEA